MGLLSTIGAASARAYGFTRSAIAAAVDAYFNRVTLLLPGNGTNGAQNNTFLDSSSNNFTITRNGNTTQGTFSPFSQTGWGNYFPGSSCLSLANNVSLQMGSSDFTMECWVYPTSTANQTIFAHEASGALGFQFSLVATSLKLEMDISSNGTSYATTVTTTSAVTLNQWNHVAVVRSGSGSGNITFYINGVKDATTGTFAGTMNAPATTFQVGCRYASGTTQSLSGYISNARITKGGALYSATFTPSTTPLTTTVSSGTVSLLTCQSNRFVDNSANAFAITVAGTTSVQSFSPFAPTAAYSTSVVGGSGYFDGTGDYLSFPTNTALTLSNGNFTAEAWIYPTATISSTQMIMGSWDGTSALSWTFSVSATNKIGFEATSGGTYTSPLTVNSANNVITPNAWNHVAVVRNGSAFNIYVNGVSVASNTSTTTIYSAPNGTKIGSNSNSQAFAGYISNSRIVVGTAVYTGAFTAPTAPFSPTMSSNPYGGSNTAAATATALLNYTNGGITDATAKNDLETVGNAQISTTQSKFGGSSMYFDGSGDYLLAPYNKFYDLTQGDFTVEGWFYRAASGVEHNILNQRGASSGWLFRINAANTVTFSIQGTVTTITSTGTIPTNTWTHIAVARSGSNMRIFINGTIDGSSSSTVNGTSATAGLRVGCDDNLVNQFNGYMDDVRITLGYARYTANFSVPTSAFPVQ